MIKELPYTINPRDDDDHLCVDVAEPNVLEERIAFQWRLGFVSGLSIWISQIEFNYFIHSPFSGNGRFPVMRYSYLGLQGFSGGTGIGAPQIINQQNWGPTNDTINDK